MQEVDRQLNTDSAAPGATVARYVADIRRRAGWLGRVRVLAIGAVATVVLAVVFALVASYVVPSPGQVLAARVVAYGLLLATAVALVAWRVKDDRAIGHAERRVAAFDGRLRTWFDACRRDRQPGLLTQLATQTAAIAAANPPPQALPRKLFGLPIAASLAAVAVFAAFLVLAPTHVRLPAERLWLGDSLAETRPRIAVEPGNAVVARGADVLLRAEAVGFQPGDLDVHARFAGGDQWEQVTMTPSGQGRHEFVLVAVMEDADYYVSGAGVRSDRFRIDVADLPRITDVALALRFPDWTRLPERRQQHGDVAALAGTSVAVTARADMPVDKAWLVKTAADAGLPDTGGASAAAATALDLDEAGTDATANFVVDGDASWHIAIEHAGQRVPISRTFLIEELADEPPTVEFVFPGRDRSVSAIEEVALRFRAHDDYGIEALSLHYAINGGAWTKLESEIALGEPQANSDHVLSLETLRVSVPTPDAAAFEAAANERHMRPGDVISVYAEAHDHRQHTRSPLYFVDVRPFDKQYRQRADAGGGDGAGGGLELSSRQREITVATWNLLDRQGETEGGLGIEDQVDVLAILQGTLKDQVETLIARSEGRRLSADEEVSVFIAELESAAAAMAEAAEFLTARDLELAVAPEQRALQHLLTAEASLRDVDVTLSSRSDGDSVSQSLSEIANLELDTARNRYETLPSRSNEAAEDADDEWDRLTELARRQEALARQRERGEQQEQPLSRWQLEELKRELESLRERLARNASERQSGQLQQQGQQDGDAPSDRNSGSEATAGLDRAMADIERAMRQQQGGASSSAQEQGVGGNAMSEQLSAEALRRSALALRQGADALRERRVDDLARDLQQAERDAGDLLAEHRRIGDQLETLQDDLLRAERAGQRYRSRDYGLYEEAEAKRQMQQELTRLAADLSQLRDEVGAIPDARQAARQIDRALEDLVDSRINERLGVAAEYFEAGSPLYVLAQEAQVERTLAEFHERLGLAAAGLASVQAAAGRELGVDDVQRLRRELLALGADGELSEIQGLSRQAQRLARQLELADSPEGLAEMRAEYRGLGAGSDNEERLYRMTLAELDALEIALMQPAGAQVRASPPRDRAYQSEAVARYFRRLSCEDCP